MGSLTLRSVGLFGTTQLARDLSLTIGSGDRIGVVANNGAGKTTLLKTLAGQAEPSAGEIIRSRGLRIGLVEQDVPEGLLTLSLHEAVRRALPPADREAESWRVDLVLDELQAPQDLRERSLSALSGGWQRLALIARCWIGEPDLLLLDEPTNHLDLEKLLRLQAWIETLDRSVGLVMASHDRAFLDAATNRTLFLRPETTRYFALPYSAAREALRIEDEAAETKQQRDLKEAHKLRQQSAKLNNIGINSGSDLLTVKAKQLKDRAAAIEKTIKTLHKDRLGDIRLANRGSHAKVMLEIDTLEVTTPDGIPLFRTGKLHLFQGDRLVLLGLNGAGKSQFVRLIHQAVNVPESVPGIRVSPTLVLGYSDQALSHLSPKASPTAILAPFKIGDARARSLLASAGLSIEKQARPIAELSFGQRARLSLLALRLAEPNFYLLDEPTNHIDISGQEMLEAEILEHEATCVLVSHDRSLVKTVGTRFLEIARGKAREIDDPETFFERIQSSIAES